MEYILRILAKVVIYFFLGVSITAQNDTVLKSDGEEMIGTVTSINENDVRFIYQKESLEYSIKKSDILKITFASGRIQYFNDGELERGSGGVRSCTKINANSNTIETHV